MMNGDLAIDGPVRPIGPVRSIDLLRKRFQTHQQTLNTIKATEAQLEDAEENVRILKDGLAWAKGREAELREQCMVFLEAMSHEDRLTFIMEHLKDSHGAALELGKKIIEAKTSGDMVWMVMDFGTDKPAEQ